MQTREQVRDLPEAHRAKPSTVPRGAPISAAIEALIAEPTGRCVYVVEGDGRLVGVVGFRDILRVANARYGASPGGLGGWIRQLRDLMPERVEDIMREATPVREETPLREALALLERTRQNDLPIVDAQDRLVGELNAMQVLALSLRVFRQTEADLAAARSKPE